jgi:hydrogenase-4 component D
MITLVHDSMISLALATVLLPFVGAALIGLAPQGAAKWLCQLFSALGLAAMLDLIRNFVAADHVGPTQTLIGFGRTAVMGVAIDGVSTLIALLVIAIGFLVAVYSASYLTTGNREHPHTGRKRYYAFLLMFIGAMSGLVFSSTIIGQLVFFEITGACSWALIGYYESPKALRSAAKALIITHVASLGLYVAAALLFADTGTFALVAIGQLTPAHKAAVLLAILVAAWGKSAQVPMHMWLPDAMEAPTPISAYLHAASMVKVGVYIFARGLIAADGAPHVVGWVGAVMAVITLIYGFAMYLPQADMKRLLAYSTITQLSYIFLGLSLSVFGSDLAFKGAVAHIFNHAFAKTLFFLVAGSLSFTAGTRLLPSLRGILTKTPMLGVSFVVAALAITGVPPFSGFFSKFAIFGGGFAVSQQNLLLLPMVIIALVESVCAFAWFLKWVGYSVPGKMSDAVQAASPLPAGMKFVLGVLVIMSLCSSFFAASWLG